MVYNDAGILRLDCRTIAHYQKIVVALSETIRLMAEIDKVIEAHGGWPDAFAPRPAEGQSEGASGPFQ